MASEVLKVGPKYQVTIPKAVRVQLGLKVGDLVQARVGKNQSIILERKRLIDFKRSLEENLRESQADYEAGRYLGPFDTADDLMEALRGPTKPRTVPFSVPKKSRVSRSAKSGSNARSRLR